MVAQWASGMYTPLQDQEDSSEAACGADILTVYERLFVDERVCEDLTIEYGRDTSQPQLSNDGSNNDKTSHGNDFLLPARGRVDKTP
ncbi:unnamed protein product [Alternaria alternata]